MANVNIRAFITDALAPLLPPGWKLIPFPTGLDTLSQPVVLLKMNSIKRATSNPQGSREAEYILTVIEPRTSPGTADDALDEKLIDLLNAIDVVPNIRWTVATRVVAANESNPAFDISLEVIFTKE